MLFLFNFYFKCLGFFRVYSNNACGNKQLLIRPRVQGLGFRVQGLEFLGSRVQGFQGLGFMVQGLGFRVFRVQGLGFRVQGLGFRVQGLGFIGCREFLAQIFFLFFQGLCFCNSFFLFINNILLILLFLHILLYLCYIYIYQFIYVIYICLFMLLSIVTSKTNFILSSLFVAIATSILININKEL